MNVYLSFLNTS